MTLSKHLKRCSKYWRIENRTPIAMLTMPYRSQTSGEVYELYDLHSTRVEVKKMKILQKRHLIVQLYMIHKKVLKKRNWPSGIHRLKCNFSSKHSEFQGNCNSSCSTSIPKKLHDLISPQQSLSELPCQNLLAKDFWESDAASTAPRPYSSNLLNTKM